MRREKSLESMDCSMVIIIIIGRSRDQPSETIKHAYGIVHYYPLNMKAIYLYII